MPFRTPFRAFDLPRATAAAALLALLAGCGGGSTSPPDDNDDDDPPPGGGTGAGAVTVTISGLPDSTDASVTITGDAGFVQQVTASGTVGGVPAGTCTVTAHPVVVAPDTLVVAPSVRVVPVVADDTTSVSLVYEAPTVADMFTAYHGPLVFQGARHNDSYVLREDWGHPPTIDDEVDTYVLPYPAGYVIDGCEITGTDVTEDGISIATSNSGMFGSGSANASLVVDSGTSVTITASASGSAFASSAYVGNGATSGVLYLGYRGNNGLYDACVVIDNPDGGEFELVFTWSYSGDVTDTAYAIWHQRFVYQIDPSVCGSNSAPTELYWGRDFTGPPSDSGTLAVPLTGTRHVVAFGMWAEASGSWAMDYFGNGGSGSASCTGSVTIEVLR